MKLEKIFDISHNRAKKLYGHNQKLVIDMLQQADYELTKRLFEKLKKDQLKTYTAVQARETMLIIQDILKKLNPKFLKLLNSESKQVSEKAFKDLDTDLLRLENFYKVAAPLAVDKAKFLLGSFKNFDLNPLRSRHLTSVERYGQFLARDFSKQIALSIVQNETNSQAMARLLQTSSSFPALKELNETMAGYLHRKEPAWFPNPQTGFVKRKYWAERIVRTEKAFAYNAAKYDSLRQANEPMKRREYAEMYGEYPKRLKKKIIAVMDNRTAYDSIAVNGQIRDYDELFVDGAGRRYAFPPARPNDRETIVPWRDDFTEENIDVKK